MLVFYITKLSDGIFWVLNSNPNLSLLLSYTSTLRLPVRIIGAILVVLTLSFVLFFFIRGLRAILSAMIQLPLGPEAVLRCAGPDRIERERKAATQPPHRPHQETPAASSFPLCRDLWVLLIARLAFFRRAQAI